MSAVWLGDTAVTPKRGVTRSQVDWKVLDGAEAHQGDLEVRDQVNLLVLQAAKPAQRG